MDEFIETLEIRIQRYKEIRDEEGGKSPLFLMYVNRIEILSEVLTLAKLIQSKDKTSE